MVLVLTYRDVLKDEWPHSPLPYVFDRMHIHGLSYDQPFQYIFGSVLCSKHGTMNIKLVINRVKHAIEKF